MEISQEQFEQIMTKDDLNELRDALLRIEKNIDKIPMIIDRINKIKF